jgi:hypothetical protein
VPAAVHYSSSSSSKSDSGTDLPQQQQQQYSVQPSELLLSDVVQVHRIEAIANAARVGLVHECGGVSDVDEVSTVVY